MLRFGLIGLGWHGRPAVFPAIRDNCQGCELVAAADLVADNRAALADQGIPLYADAREMMESEQLDAAYVATLPSAHKALTLMALEHGLHVVCEKPLAERTEEAVEMAAAADQADKLLVVMFENRYEPYNRKIREWIREGRIGRVEAMHIQSFGSHPRKQPRRTNLMNAAGCLDCGIHQLDLARFFVDAGEWERMHALGSWFDEPVAGAPHLGILARLDNGVMVTFEDSFSYGLSLPKLIKKRNLAIVGTRGVITDAINEETGEVVYQLITEEGIEETPFVQTLHRDGIPHVLDDMACLLAGGEHSGFLPTARDGVIAQAAVDECLAQAAASRRVPTPLGGKQTSS